MPVPKVNPAGGTSGDGRDSWCTPRWLADLIGKVYLDPCSNPRSHIRAHWKASLEGGGNGLASSCWPGARGADLDTGESVQASVDTDVFINPPYSRGQVMRWVTHWKTARFIFLLRWDPSTEWFSVLLPSCTHIWFPDRRVNFEPPPGVLSSSNPYPHALYLRDPKVALQLRLRAAGYLIPVDKVYAAPDSDEHDEYLKGDAAGGEIGGSQGSDGGDDGRAGEGVGPVWVPAGDRSGSLAGEEDWSTYFGQARTEVQV